MIRDKQGRVKFIPIPMAYGNGTRLSTHIVVHVRSNTVPSPILCVLHLFETRLCNHLNKEEKDNHVQITTYVGKSSKNLMPLVLRQC